jgi:hypothetical protein
VAFATALERLSQWDISERDIKFDQPRNTSFHRVDEVIERSTDFAAVHESDVGHFSEVLSSVAKVCSWG